jgi:hypothetical protein
MIRINNPWGASAWTTDDNLARVEQLCATLNRLHGDQTHHVHHATALQRLAIWLQPKPDLLAGDESPINPVWSSMLQIADDAADALAKINHQATLFSVVGSHIEGRPDIDPAKLHQFANAMSQLADRLERQTQ